MEATDVEPPPWEALGSEARAWRDGGGEVWAYAYEGDDDVWLRLPGLASYRLGEAGSPATAVSETTRRDRIVDAYVRSVLPFALQRHGNEVLHGSAVLFGDRVVAVCGPSKSGKSTFAYGLNLRGHRVWADDAVVLERSGARTIVVRYPHQIRLRPPSVEFFGAQARISRPLREDELVLPEHEARPLRAIFVLRRTEEDGSRGFSFRRYSPGTALLALLANAYWFDTRNMQRRRRTVHRYLALCAEVPVYEIEFGADLSNLGSMLDELERISASLEAASG